jgi:hypothetical protein
LTYDLKTLDAEFSTQLLNSSTFRQSQRNYVEYYNNNVFYQRAAGDPIPKRSVGVNLLKAFADKNIHYTSDFPKMKKPASGTDIQSRMTASLIEKVLAAAWKTNNGSMKQRRWASDGTLMAEAYSLTDWDIDERSPVIKRLDPRYCHASYSNDVDSNLLAFWYAVPMTKEAIHDKFGIDPGTSGIATGGVTLDGNAVPIDGKERFYVIIRWDDKVRAAWVGNQFLEKPHKHMWDTIPVDICRPFESGNTDSHGGFYLEQLVPLQAEFNETFRRRANIIRKLSNPAVWGRGIMANQFDEVKKALEGTGGFVGLKANGELNFLQLQETKVLDDHLASLESEMKNLSGMGDAAFGRSGGANTSAAAVAMYFQPTVKHIMNQWIAWCAFYEAINSKILRSYQIFGRTQEQFKVYGQRQGGTFEPIEGVGADGQTTYSISKVSGGYTAEFTKEMLGEDTCTSIIVPDITPRDETATRNQAIQAVTSGFMSRVSAYEQYGMFDPEDEIQLLQSEREDPRLHPEVFQQVSQAQATLAGAANPANAPQLPAETATAPGVTAPAR